ncbi:MAG: hypothetical protein IK115_12470, partial [Lachnospiraceae bacterium]|nr:hypothetical protein [Lachnospiraceae bacterium]
MQKESFRTEAQHMITAGEKIDGRAYREDLRQYTAEVLENYGLASQSAEREIIRLAECGNSVALKLYADMVFYGKLLRKDPFSTAFGLYLRSADLTIPEEGEWRIGDRSYPPALWALAYYLLDYRQASVLLHSDEIPCIEGMKREERLSHALSLALSCIADTPLAGAVNLVGRILKECAAEEQLFEILKPQLKRQLAGREFSSFSFPSDSFEDRESCGAAAERFFHAAVEDGYVYACNNLAAREADEIVRLHETEADVTEHVKQYISALTMAADKYEPYAANRLGLFYITGEIKSAGGKAVFREYVDFPRA